MCHDAYSLCPAGHLPQKVGENRSVSILLNLHDFRGTSDRALPFLVGEMPDRAEGVTFPIRIGVFA